MWSYDKRLQFPVKIKNPDPQLAKIVISQLGGPDGELGASMRYLNQRYAMPYKECKGILTDIGTEELAHMEMISSILYQLTRNLRRNKSARAASMPTLSIIQPVFILSLPPVSRGRPQPSSPRATPSPICSKIWPRNRRRARPTTICFV